MSRRKRHLKQAALGTGCSLEGVVLTGSSSSLSSSSSSSSLIPRDGDAAVRRELAVVTDTPGGNILEVVTASALSAWQTGLLRADGDDQGIEDARRTLCRLPARFVKTLWVRRGSHVVVITDATGGGGSGGCGSCG